MGAPNGRYPQMGAGGRAPVRASSVTDIHSLYSGLPGMLTIFQKFPKFFKFYIHIQIVDFSRFLKFLNSFWNKNFRNYSEL